MCTCPRNVIIPSPPHPNPPHCGHQRTTTITGISYTCMYEYMYSCIYVILHICIDAYRVKTIDVYMHKHMYIISCIYIHSCICVCVSIRIYIYTHRYIYIHVLYQMKHWILSVDGMFHALQKSTPQVAASSKPFQLPDRESCMAFHLLHSVSSQTFLVEEMIIMIQMNLNSDGSKQYFTCHHTSTLMILANSRMSMMLLLVFGIMGVASQS